MCHLTMTHGRQVAWGRVILRSRIGMGSLRAKRHCRAFTLIEILVVIVIVSIISSLVVVKLMPNPNSVVKEEAIRLASLIDHAVDEALLTGVDYSLVLSDKGYEFHSTGAEGIDQWVPVQNNEALKPRFFDSVVDSIEIKLDNKDHRLIVDHVGWSTAGVITLRSSKGSWSVNINPIGQTSVESVKSR